MTKIKLVTCDSGLNLHALGMSFRAWKYDEEELLEGDVVFETEKSNTTELEINSYEVFSGSEIQVLEVITIEY